MTQEKTLALISTKTKKAYPVPKYMRLYSLGLRSASSKGLESVFKLTGIKIYQTKAQGITPPHTMVAYS